MGKNNFTGIIEYYNLINQLYSTNAPPSIISNLTLFGETILESDMEKKYSEPMFMIGLYIAVASLCCIFAMFFDLVNGFRSRKLWFPVKYFPINAFTLTLIGVAMKLTVDLSGSMPGNVDQVTKLGSMAFMCAMMANFLPCLATMDSDELLTNVTALGVLVITLVVNVCIQIRSGVIGGIPNNRAVKDSLESFGYEFKPSMVLRDLIYTIVAKIYVTFLLMLLIILASSSLAILKRKQIIEPNYQQCHEAASKELQSTGGELLTVEKLQQHVSKHWIMAGSGSPQFILACSVTTTASGVICMVTFFLHALTFVWAVVIIVVNHEANVKISKSVGKDKEYESLFASNYDWSTLVIFFVQSAGVLVGTVAPVLRCFASMSFKFSNHIKVFRVEKYWTHKLKDWKYGSISLPLLSISLPFGNHTLKVVVRTLKNVILNVCILLQAGVVVVCKIIALIPVLLMLIPILVIMCWRCLKRGLCSSWGTVVENSAEDREYVLQPLSTRALKRLLKSFSLLIQRSEKKQPENLMKLIEKESTDGFQGAKMLEKDDHQVQCSPSKVEVVYPNRWSLPVVTLTTIAITLPNTGEVEVESLLKSVREGLKYVTLVEETLNAPNGYGGSIETAAKKLWEEVDFCHTWLGIGLKDITSEVKTTSSQVDTTTQTVQVFLKQAYKILEGSKISDDASKITSICAKSMSRVTETIIGDKESHKELFGELSSKIADIMAECLTNLPQVIENKCHTDVIEKREASVEDATKLLGETKMIIKTLQDKRSAAYLCEP